ncbi:MAG: glycosyltransferase family 4 protein [Gammaproteobacteria bacterium]
MAINDVARGRLGEQDASARGMRVLLLAGDTFPPKRVDLTVLYGEELSRRGHRIDWLLQSDAPCSRAYVTRYARGVAIVGPTDTGCSLARRVRKHVLSIVHDFKVLGLLRKKRYDVVEVKDKFVSGVFALVAARMLGVKFVYWLSYPFPEHYLYRYRAGDAPYPLLYWLRGTAFKLLLYKVLLPGADHVFVQSEQMRRDIGAVGVTPAKMTAVPMGVRLTEDPRADASDRSVIPAGERCFVYLGTLVRVRRLDFLVRVLAIVRREIPDAKLYLVGRGEEPADEEAILAEAARLGVSSAVVLVGELPRDQALKYVHDADVCVSPFYPTPILRSTSPTKLVEYLAMGKAVVASDHPEQRRVIEESGGGLCVPWDETEFARAIVRLMSCPALARRMGENGRRFVEQNRSYAAIADLVERELVALAATATPRIGKPQLS